MNNVRKLVKGRKCMHTLIKFEKIFNRNYKKMWKKLFVTLSTISKAYMFDSKQHYLSLSTSFVPFISLDAAAA